MSDDFERRSLDFAIRRLWSELADLSKTNERYLTEQDLELWTMVTMHKAIQDRLTLREDD